MYAVCALVVEAAKISRELAELEGGGTAAGPRPSVVPTKGMVPRMSYLYLSSNQMHGRLPSQRSTVAPTAEP